MLDDDFFELDEDLLNITDFNKKVEETVNYEEDISQCVRFLNCTGDDQLTKHTFHEQGFIANDEIKLIESNFKKFHNQKLFDLEFSEDVLTDPTILQDLLGKARMNVQTLIVSSRENSTFVTKKSYFLMRQQTSTFLFQLRHLLFTGRIKHNIVEDLLRPFALYLEQLNALPIVDVLHTIYSTLGNESTSPAYHLLHGHIEWRWIYLTICLRIEQDKLHQNLMITENTLRNTEFEEKLQLLLYDLMLISAAKFNKLHTTELPLKSPFTCTCMKEIWLLVQLLIERLHENGRQLNSFWHYFETALNLHRERKSPYAVMKQPSISRELNTLFLNDSTVFPLWLLNGVAVLHGFSENGIFHGPSSLRVRENSDFLESVLKAFVLAEPSEQHLRVALLIVNSLINWWPHKSELIMTFWEYFHKKLNSSFYLNGTTPAALAVIGKTATEYLEQVQKLINNENITADMSSYTIFMNLMSEVLKRLVQQESRNQIMKIIGRIFIKFGESKLYALTEVGIHNLLTLFLILASVVGVKEIGQRLYSIVLQLRLEKLSAPRQCCVMKGHMALLILYSNQEMNMQNYVNRLLEQVNKLNSDENKLPVLRIMIDGLERIYKKSDIFAMDEYMLFDSWIIEYLSRCSQSEQEKCLQFINKMFVRMMEHKLQYSEQHEKVINILYRNILPFVKQIYRQSKVYGGVPDIAATFCIHANGNNGLANFQDLFNHFTEANCCDIQTTTKFLVNILTDEFIDRIEQITILRLWIKCSILSQNQNEDVRQLTKIVCTLSSFKLLCKATETELLSAKEPLNIFFAHCGESYTDADTQDSTKKEIASHVQAILTGFEKWVPMSESPPIINKIHIAIGLIILYCSPIVYVRSKPTCFFSVIMDHYILPLPLLMGKPQKIISIQAVHKVWHLIVGGIEKLDYKSDAQLEKVLTDLIVKWIPQFRLHPNQRAISKPFVISARQFKSSTLQFILEKMINNFLSAQRREIHQNAPIVVNILSEILGDASNETEIVRVLLNTTIITLYEHAMMVDENLPSRTMIFDFFGALFKSPAYLSSLEIRTIVTSNLKTLTTKNLSYYATFFFQFMQKLARINSRCVAEVLPHIKEQVEHVENLRQAGMDARLRNLLRQLEDVVRPR